MYLRQSTASQVILLGYFLDSVDGNTEETGLTIANTDIKLHKAGATTLANKNSGGATHISNGLYYTVLDATDTDTLGNLVVSVHVSGALPVKATYTVLAANVYDSLVAGSDLLQVDATQISGDGTAADNLESAFDGTGYAITGLVTRMGTAQGGASQYITIDAGASGTDDTYVGSTVTIISGTGAGQSRLIWDYGTTTKRCYVSPIWTTNPDSSSVFAILPHGNTAMAGFPNDSSLAAIGNMQDFFDGTGYAGGTAKLGVDVVSVSGDTTAADNLELQYDGTGLTGDTFPATQMAASTILADTNELQTNQGNWLTATGFSTHTAGDVVTAMQAVADDFKADVSGLLTSAAYTAPDNSSIAAILVDTGTTIPASLSAIKAKTDSLTFTVSGQVDSNITYVNDVEVGGTGTDVDPWNPA